MTRRTAGTSPARISNHFEASDAAIPLGSLLTATEVAEMTGLSTNTIAEMCRMGRLNATRYGGKHWYVGRSEVERLIRQRMGAQS